MERRWRGGWGWKSIYNNGRGNTFIYWKWWERGGMRVGVEKGREMRVLSEPWTQMYALYHWAYLQCTV